MRITAFILSLLAAGCGNTAVINLLCDACLTDGDCGGNPCFADVSNQRYCGRPCGSGCPTGFSCEPVSGTGGQVVKTCFPTNESCVAIMPQPGVDLAGASSSHDMAQAGSLPDMSTSGPHDLAMVPCTPPAGGTVTFTGGTVDRLYFGYTGDTRPVNSSSSYPSSLQTVINGIFTAMAGHGVEFALDGGDHMEPGNLSDAQGNMASYKTATDLLGKPVFMTMGNHECEAQFGADCGGAGAATSDYRMKAYLASLSQISGQTSPYYRFDVMTNAGKATFLVVADDAWNSTQENWLTTELTDADANSKYTFVSKHHPDGNMDQPTFQTIYNLVTSHKYTLFLNGHSHEYKHQYNDKRAVVMGLGGAPFDNPAQHWWGYLTVMQCPNDSVTVTVYDESTGAIQDSFNVPAQ